MNKIIDRLPLLLALLVVLLSGLTFSSRLQAAPAAQGTNGLSAADAAALVELHNEWRQRFNVPPLVWDDTVAAVAQDWAGQIAASGDFAHRPNNKYGENIWAGTTGFFGPSSVVNAWGSEVADYDFATNTCAAGKVCGHFTQLVWANTTKLGCGKGTGSGNDYYVCNYDPPGNFIGQTPGAKPAAPPATVQPIDVPTTAPTTVSNSPTGSAAATTEPTAAVTSAPQATPQGTTELSADDAMLLLNAHNDWRQRYNVPLLAWDEAAAAAAQVWAEQIATTNSFSRPAGNSFGSNNYFGTASFVSPQDPVNFWGAQSSHYDFATNTCAAGQECRSFTQLVWADTLKVGCGKFVANDKAYFVCNYDPAGNITGQTPGASPALIATTTDEPSTPSKATVTVTPTPTATAALTSTLIVSPTLTVTSTVTITGTRTATPTGTLSATLAATTTVSATTTRTATASVVSTLTVNGTSGLSGDDAAAMLNAHNDWRQRFGVPPLAWNDTVASVAQEWADHLAETNDFSHRPNNQYGENLWAGTTGFFVPADSVNSWGSEVADYDFATNSCAADKVCGHFTQLVWARTLQVGCGKATGNGNDYYVCNYSPPGNMVGETTGASPAPAPIDSQPTDIPTPTSQPQDAQPTETPTATPEPIAVAPTNTQPESAIDYSTPNLTIPGAGVLWFTVPNEDGATELTIRIPGGALSGLVFQVYAPSQMAEWPDTTHSGTSNIEGDDLVWRGAEPEAGTFYVVVGNNTIVPVAFSIIKE